MTQPEQEAREMLAPLIPTEEMWGGLARQIIMWMDMGQKTPRALFQHLERSGHEIPQWLRDEPEMKHLDHVPSKGTRAVIVYRAMIEPLNAFAARPTAGIDREVVARIIDPLAFKSAESMLDYCERQKDSPDVALRYAHQTYGPSMQEALTKADAILALLPTPAKTGERGAWRPISTAPAACHVIAARFDDSCGEWIMAVVMSPPSKPFTHWQPLPDAPIVGEG